MFQGVDCFVRVSKSQSKEEVEQRHMVGFDTAHKGLVNEWHEPFLEETIVNFNFNISEILNLVLAFTSLLQSFDLDVFNQLFENGVDNLSEPVPAVGH